MFTLSLKSLLSPRLLALPAIALAVIVTLAHTSGRSGVAVARAPTVIRALNCAVPAGAMDRACALAQDGLRAVR